MRVGRSGLCVATVVVAVVTGCSGAPGEGAPCAAFLGYHYEAGEGAVYFLDADLEPLDKFGDFDVSEPAFSPDGAMVVFSRGEGAVSDTTGSEFMSVFVVDTDGMDERRLSREMYDLSPAWSPNGQRVAFIRRSQGTRGVVVVDLASGAAETVAAGVEWRQVIWRSDDEVVVTDWGSGGGMDPDLVAVTVSTGETRKVGTAPSAGTVWNAERTKVASSRYGDPRDVVVLDVATGEIAAVPGSASRSAEPFVWTPEGDLLFSQNVRGPNVNVALSPGGTGTPTVVSRGFPETGSRPIAANPACGGLD